MITITLDTNPIKPIIDPYPKLQTNALSGSIFLMATITEGTRLIYNGLADNTYRKDWGSSINFIDYNKPITLENVQ